MGRGEERGGSGLNCEKATVEVVDTVAATAQLPMTPPARAAACAFGSLRRRLAHLGRQTPFGTREGGGVHHLCFLLMVAPSFKKITTNQKDNYIQYLSFCKASLRTGQTNGGPIITSTEMLHNDLVLRNV